ncbi:hypothetical protein G6F57_017022 [Rhizopus arrhizus]|nr:hypothetical protein G6F57_017022 [Rhizopus arrhizus]
MRWANLVEQYQGSPLKWGDIKSLKPKADRPLRAPMVTLCIQGGKKDKLRPGDLLGALPGIAQPSQKRFDTLLAARLREFDASQAVYVEAESRKIGSIALPPALLQAMHRGACVEVISSREDRAAFLQQDYAQLFENPDWLKTQLQRLLGLHSRDVINGWLKMVDEGQRIDLARELIDRHYDPAYARSSHTHFTQLPQATRMAFRPNDADGG